MRAKHPHQLTRADFESRWERRLVWPAALAVGLLTGYCDARADTIGVHIYTPHFAEDKDIPARLRNSDVTPGLYWRGESGLTLGVVRNSLRRLAFYAAYTVDSEDKRWALSMGAITGYRYRTERGFDLCPPEERNVPCAQPCTFRHGNTNAVLRPLIAPSWAWIEAKPYIGATPRVALLGKAVSFSLEAQF